MNTDNPIIHQYIKETRDKINYGNTVLTIASYEIGDRRARFPKSSPSSFRLLWQARNLDWVCAIIGILFEDGAIGTFCGEYSDYVKNVVESNNPWKLQYPIYRNPINGESIFHIAAHFQLVKHVTDERAMINECNRIISVYKRVDDYLHLGSSGIIDMLDLRGRKFQKSMDNFMEVIERADGGKNDSSNP